MRESLPISCGRRIALCRKTDKAVQANEPGRRLAVESEALQYFAVKNDVHWLWMVGSGSSLTLSSK